MKKNVNKQEVGKRIFTIRNLLGLTMEEFGKKVSNAKKGNVSVWESGTSIPAPKRLEIICQLGNVSMEYLLYGTTSEANTKNDFDEIGLEFYHELLETYPISTYEGKVLRFFDEDERNFLIKTGIQKAVMELDWARHHLTVKDIYTFNASLILLPIVQTFTDEYETQIKTNGNLLRKAIAIIDQIGKLQNYVQYGEKKQLYLEQFNLKAETKLYETAIHQTLSQEIHDIFHETRNKLEHLFSSYPDQPSAIGKIVELFPHQLKESNNHSYVISNKVLGQEQVDVASLPIDPKTRDLILSSVKSFNEEFTRVETRIKALHDLNEALFQKKQKTIKNNPPSKQNNPVNQIELSDELMLESTVFHTTEQVIVMEKENGHWIYPNTIGAAAGTGTSHHADSDFDAILLPHDEVYTADHIVSMYVRGDSMEPKYFDGDVIWVDTQDKSIDKYQVGVFDLEDGRVVKQMGDQELISINRKFPDIELNEYVDFSTYGKVIDVIRREELEKFKEIRWV